MTTELAQRGSDSAGALAGAAMRGSDQAELCVQLPAAFPRVEQITRAVANGHATLFVFQSALDLLVDSPASALIPASTAGTTEEPATF
jgi:hypothetical protein